MSSSRVARECVVANAEGLHARPAMKLVEAANRFAGEVRLYKLGEDAGDADAKSIMQVLTLLGVQGTAYRVEAEGADAAAAVEAIAELFESKFGEE